MTELLYLLGMLSFGMLNLLLLIAAGAFVFALGNCIIRKQSCRRPFTNFWEMMGFVFVIGIVFSIAITLISGGVSWFGIFFQGRINLTLFGFSALILIVTTAIARVNYWSEQDENILLPAPNVSVITTITPELEKSIQKRWSEAQRCQAGGNYLSAIILMGSILEALLLARASMSRSDVYSAKNAPKDKNGKPRNLDSWNLNSLINVAVELGWLKSDRAKFSHALRESRNVVHPNVEVTTNANFDEATCKTSWEVLRASVNDLLSSV